MKYDPFEEREKKSFEQRFKIPTFEETLAHRKKASLSKYPLRFMGSGNKDVYMREEDRDGNFHIIGTSGHGKSKYMEYHIRKDIDMGLGLCLIDPSDNGATFRSILEYCAFKNHKKVCIIDPSTLYDYGKIACIQPLNPRYATKSVQSAKDAINILFGTSIDSTPRIQDNLTALFRMLTAQGLTLYESTYFTEYADPRWKGILEASKDKIMQEKFKTPGHWRQEFSTTITRLNVFRDEPISLMIGASKGIDFAKMIDEGWVILCNLYPLHISRDISRFLGILIIAQLHRAIEELNPKFGDSGRKFYLYIDEAGRFATPQIDDILTYNRKSGFHLVFAHHFISQLTNPLVRDAITSNTTNKIMFHVEDDAERLRMLKELRFGDNASDANHKYRNLPKRKFLCKIGKEYAVELEAPYIEPVQFNDRHATIERYIRERLQDPWYQTKGDIEQQIKSRIKTVDNTNDIAGNDTPSPIKRTVSNGETIKHTDKTRRKSLLDLGAEAEKFIRNDKNSK